MCDFAIWTVHQSRRGIGMRPIGLYITRKTVTTDKSEHCAFVWLLCNTRDEEFDPSQVRRGLSETSPPQYMHVLGYLSNLLLRPVAGYDRWTRSHQDVRKRTVWVYKGTQPHIVFRAHAIIRSSVCSQQNNSTKLWTSLLETVTLL